MLRLKNVKKQYPNFLLDCSLEVPRGCITGLIGQNGAGKTTAFKAVLDLISVDSGSIDVMGKDHRKLSFRDKEKIGVVLSDSGFYEGMNSRQTAAVMAGFYRDFSQKEFLDLCRRFQIPDNKKVRDFSTGMKMKMKILAALSHKPELLILDEPTAGLDVVAREDVLDMLREYMEPGDRSILISSHISTDLEGLCDDLYLIHEGKVVLHEETDVLLSDYALIKASEEEYRALDRSCLIRVKKESYGYSCLTKEKQYYLENYPKLVIEAGSVDKVLVMMAKGAEL